MIEKTDIRVPSNLGHYYANEGQCYDDAKFGPKRKTRPVTVMRFRYVLKYAFSKGLRQGSPSSRICYQSITNAGLSLYLDTLQE